MHIKSSKRGKLVDSLPDVRHGIFGTDTLVNFKQDVRITMKLIEIIQKPHLFKIYA